MPKAGYVYILENPALPGYAKIGMTRKQHPDERARQLNTTGVPGHWQPYAYWYVDDARGLEKRSHRYLKNYRIDSRIRRRGKKPEHFKLDPREATAMLRQHLIPHLAGTDSLDPLAAEAALQERAAAAARQAAQPAAAQAVRNQGSLARTPTPPAHPPIRPSTAVLSSNARPGTAGWGTAVGLIALGSVALACVVGYAALPAGSTPEVRRPSPVAPSSPPEAAPKVHQGEPPATGSPPSPACGAVSAAISSSTAGWRRYSCRSRPAAGDRWPDCLPWRAYAQEPEHGCPGAQRCCPPGVQDVDAPAEGGSEPDPNVEVFREVRDALHAREWVEAARVLARAEPTEDQAGLARLRQELARGAGYQVGILLQQGRCAEAQQITRELAEADAASE